MTSCEVVRMREWPLTWEASARCDACRDVHTTYYWAFIKGKRPVKLATELRVEGWLIEGSYTVCRRCRTKLGEKGST